MAATANEIDRINDLHVYWTERKRRSLRAATDRQAAEALLAEIYRWSARQKRWGENAGAWVTNMDCLCWQRQPQLHRLAVTAGGWWRWCDGVVFVPRKRWLRIFDAWQQKEQAARADRAADQLFARLTKSPENGFEKWCDKRSAKADLKP